MSIGGGASLGSAVGEIRIDVSKARAEIKQLQATIGQFGTASGDALSRVATGLGLLGAAKGIGGIFTGAVGSAANFESAISAIGAVTGATGDQLDSLRDKALQLGKDTSFSATEAASAIEELGKAGLSTKDILAGAADGATALAAAGAVSIPQAATTIATALNQFGLAGEQATHVADLIAAASSTSATGVIEIGDSLSYVGTAAASLNIPIEDTVTAIAALADVGVVGSRAGTALGSALSSLSAPTDKAATAMADLGISAYDSTGAFKPLPTLIEDIANATKGLSEEQRNAALQGIFDEQGMRAINGLLKTQEEGADAAGKSWKDYAANVNVSGAAADQAGKRLDNFKGSMEQLRGSVETLGIIVGSLFLPALRDVVDAATAAVNVLIGMPQPLQLIGAAAGIGTGAILGMAGALTLAGPQLKSFKKNIAEVGRAFREFRLFNPYVLALVAAIALFGLAYKTNFGGFADFVDGQVASVVSTLRTFADAFSDARAAIQRFGTLGNVGAIFAALGQAIDAAFGTDVAQLFGRAGKAADNLGEGVGRVARQFGRLSKIIKRDGLGEGIDRLFGDIGKKMLSGFGDAFSAPLRLLGTFVSGIKTGFKPLDTILANAGAGWKLYGSAIEAVFDGDWGRAAEASARGLRRGFLNFAVAGEAILSGLRSAFDAIPWGTLWDIAMAGIVAAAGSVIPLGSLALNAAVGFAGDLFDLSQQGVDWIVAKLPGVGTAAINLGAVFLHAAVSLAGDLFDVAAQGLGWVSAKIPALGKLALTTAGATVSALVELAGVIGDLAATGLGWVADQIPPLGSLALTAGASTISALVTLAGVIGDVAAQGLGWVYGKLPTLGALALTMAASTISGIVTLAGDIGDLAAQGVGWVLSKIPVLGALAMTMATSTVSALVTLAGVIGDLAAQGIGWVSAQIPALGALALTMASSTMSAVVTLAGDIGDLAAQGIGWVYGKVPVIGALALTMAASTISAVVTLAGDIGDLAPDAWAWVVGKIENTLDHTLALGTLALTAATVDFTNLVTSDQFTSAATAIGAGIVAAVTGLATLAADVGGAIVAKIKDVDWATLVTADSFKLGTSFGTALRSAIGAAAEVLTGLASGIGDALADMDLSTIDWATVATTVATALGVGLLAAPAAIAALGVAIASFLGGAITGLVFGEGDADWGKLAGQIGTGIITGITGLAKFGAGILLAIAQAIVPGEGDFGAEGQSVAGALVGQIIIGLAGKGFDILLAIAKAITPVAGDFVDEGKKIGSAVWDGITGFFSTKTITDLLSALGGGGGEDEAADSSFDPNNIPGVPNPNTAALGKVGAADGLVYGTAFGGGAGTGVTDAGPEVLRRLNALFGGGEGSAGTEGAKAGTTYSSQFNTAAAAIIKTPAPPAAPGQPQNPNANRGAAPAAAPVAPAPVVFPAPDLTLYAAGLAAAVTALQITITGLGVLAQGLAVPLGAAATAAVNTFNQGLAGGYALSIQATQFAMEAIRQAANVGSLYESGYSVGSSLGEGMAAGIASQINYVAAAAQRLVAAGQLGAQKKGEIASPSKLFARTIGVPIGQGIALGIDSTRSLVGAATSNLLGGIPSQSVSTSQMLGRQPTGRSAQGGGGGTTIINNVLRSDEWIEVVRKSERGHGAATYVDGLMPAFAGMMGS